MEQPSKPPVALPPNVKHISAKQTDRLYTLIQNADQRQLARLSATTTVNPTVITLLFWFLPGFFVIHNFFIRYWWAAIFQLLLFAAIIIFFLMPIGMESEMIQLQMEGGDITGYRQRIDNVRMVTKCLIAFLALWYLLDGITVYFRTQSSNYRKLNKAVTRK